MDRVTCYSCAHESSVIDTSELAAQEGWMAVTDGDFITWWYCNNCKGQKEL